MSMAFTSYDVSAATDEVSLLSVNVHQVDAAGGYMMYGLGANIKVKNLAYEKVVTIHYKNSYNDVWQDCAATYAYSIDGQYEVWYADPIFYSGYGSIEYSIKYEVAGQTYWDNNYGENYITYTDGTTNM